MNSKQKGKRAELELSRKFKEYGYDTRRSVQYNGRAEEGQADLVGLPGIHVECKHVERLNIYDAISQAVRDAAAGILPVVFHRKNHHEWLVTMRFTDWVRIYKRLSDNDLKEIQDEMEI